MFYFKSSKSKASEFQKFQGRDQIVMLKNYSFLNRTLLSVHGRHRMMVPLTYCYLEVWRASDVFEICNQTFQV